MTMQYIIVDVAEVNNSGQIGNEIKVNLEMMFLVMIGWEQGDNHQIPIY